MALESTFCCMWNYGFRCEVYVNHGWRNLFKSGGHKSKSKNVEKFCALNCQLWRHKHWNMTSLTSFSMFKQFYAMFYKPSQRPLSTVHPIYLTNSCKHIDKWHKPQILSDNSLSFWDIAIQLEEPHKTCRRTGCGSPAAVFSTLFYTNLLLQKKFSLILILFLKITQLHKAARALTDDPE